MRDGENHALLALVGPLRFSNVQKGSLKDGA